MDPQLNSAIENVQKLWPLHLCELIAQETNKYALQRGTVLRTGSRGPTTAEENWTFLGMVLAMSKSSPTSKRLLVSGSRAFRQFGNCMPRDRFKFLFVACSFMIG